MISLSLTLYDVCSRFARGRNGVLTVRGAHVFSSVTTRLNEARHVSMNERRNDTSGYAHERNEHRLTEAQSREWIRQLVDLLHRTLLFAVHLYKHRTRTTHNCTKLFSSTRERSSNVTSSADQANERLNRETASDSD